MYSNTLITSSPHFPLCSELQGQTVNQGNTGNFVLSHAPHICSTAVWSRQKYISKHCINSGQNKTQRRLWARRGVDSSCTVIHIMTRLILRKQPPNTPRPIWHPITAARFPNLCSANASAAQDYAAFVLQPHTHNTESTCRLQLQGLHIIPSLPTFQRVKRISRRQRGQSLNDKIWLHFSSFNEHFEQLNLSYYWICCHVLHVQSQPMA